MEGVLMMGLGVLAVFGVTYLIDKLVPPRTSVQSRR